MRASLAIAAGLALLALGCGGGGGGGGGSAGDDPAPGTWALSGFLTGDVVQGVTVLLSGDAARSTTTDVSGAWTLAGVPEGAYTVTPVMAGYAFTPANRQLAVAGSDVAALDFASTRTSSLYNVAPPSSPVRLVFIHHSCGSNWLGTGNGNLGDTLDANNYYVRDTNYGWDAPNNPDIGSSTDIGHWYTWFADPARSGDITGALYATDSKTVTYTTSVADPGGENEVILFKSCYPNSNVRADNAQPPAALYGQACDSSAHTLGNCREVYRQILAAFKDQPQKMFVVVTAPPLVSASTDAIRAANARSLNDWLVSDWLAEGGWENRNVYVFDFFNVLTDAANHHRVSGGVIEHVSTNGDDYSAYGQGGDSHPNAAGNQKSTAEFVPLLNAYYHLWQQYLGNE